MVTIVVDMVTIVVEIVKIVVEIVTTVVDMSNIVEHMVTNVANIVANVVDIRDTSKSPTTNTDWQVVRERSKTMCITLNKAVANTTTLVSAISRMECIPSWGQPTSTVWIPSLVEMIGPMVEPHGISFRITQSYSNSRPATICPMIKVKSMMAYQNTVVKFIDKLLNW